MADSNVLIHLTNIGSSDHLVAEGALRRLEDVGAQVLYTSQNLAEFWNVCTRVGRGGLALSVEEAARRMEIIESRFLFLPEVRKAGELFREFLVRYRVQGVQVHDARLAAVMVASDVREILTFDKDDFRRFVELTVIHPQGMAK